MEHPDFITVAHGIRGYFPVWMTYNLEGYYEPWDSHPYSSSDREQAGHMAVLWAVEMGLNYRRPATWDE